MHFYKCYTVYYNGIRGIHLFNGSENILFPQKPACFRLRGLDIKITKFQAFHTNWFIKSHILIVQTPLLSLYNHITIRGSQSFQCNATMLTALTHWTFAPSFWMNTEKKANLLLPRLLDQQQQHSKYSFKPKAPFLLLKVTSTCKFSAKKHPK